jgi:hypothetical protein
MGAHTRAYREGIRRIEEPSPVKKQPNETLLSTTEAAARIGRAEITLRLWRWQDNPHQPPYVRVGSRGVKYRADDLDHWIASRTHQPGSKQKDRSPGRHRGRPGPR